MNTAVSRAMRTRELRAGDKPYRRVMECSDVARWRGEHKTGFLDRNHLGRRSERVYQNRTLPGKLAGKHPSV